MNGVWSVLQVLGQHREARAIVFSSPKDSSLSPVGPENVLLEDSHSVRVHDPLHNHLSVLTSQSSPLYLVSEGRREGRKELSKKKSEQYGICCNIIIYKTLNIQ